MTEPIHATLAGRELLPAQHYLDSGYPSAALVVDSLRRWGVTLVTPLLADQSRQAKQAAGYDRAGFTIDFDTLKATCPQGQSSTCWNEVTQRGTHAIVIKFAAATCRPCPVRDQCTRTTHPQYGRQLTVPPREVHHAQLAARAALRYSCCTRETACLQECSSSSDPADLRLCRSAFEAVWKLSIPHHEYAPV